MSSVGADAPRTGRVAIRHHRGDGRSGLLVTAAGGSAFRQEGKNAMSAPGTAPLRIGIIGSGFMAGFHLEAMQAVREVVIGGVHSPTREHRDGYARRVDAAGLGPCRSFTSVEALAGSEDIDAIWIAGPNDQRVAHI